MVSALTHWASVLAAYRRRGAGGLDDIADRLESAAHEQPGGKFSKSRALYLPQAPLPPTLWRTSCGRCRFWESGEPGEAGRCHIVGREGDPFGGERIHYRGWCAFWMPPAGEPALAWVAERLRPDGRSSVRGAYDPETTAKERRRRERTPAPTEPDAHPEAIRRAAGERDSGREEHADEQGTDDGG